MSINKMLVPGFGPGACFGSPVTIALGPTTTVGLTGTVLPVGQYIVTSLIGGANIVGVSTSNGVTGTWNIVTGATTAGIFINDGSSLSLVNTTTTANPVFIAV